MPSDFIEDFAETDIFSSHPDVISFSLLFYRCVNLVNEILKYQAYLYSFEISCHCLIKRDYPEFPCVTLEFLHGSPFNLNSFKAQMFRFLCSLQCGKSNFIVLHIRKIVRIELIEDYIVRTYYSTECYIFAVSYRILSGVEHLVNETRDILNMQTCFQKTLWLCLGTVNMLIGKLWNYTNRCASVYDNLLIFNWFRTRR